MEPSGEESGRLWFDWYTEQQKNNSIRLPAEGGPYHSPCCSCRTLDERGGSDICPVCFWEDDGQDDQDAAVVRGGPNGSLSLQQARLNYLSFGACEEKMLINVRRPLPSELPRKQS